MAEVDPDSAERVSSAEDLDRTVDELLALVDERALSLYEAQTSRPIRGRRGGRVRAVSPRKPNVTDALRADLRSALEDEIVVAPFASPALDIEPSEFEREIMKKALVKLKLADLRQVAASLGADWRGTEEDVADRVVRALGFDEAKVARLVIDHEEQPRQDRGVTERLYPMASGLDDPARVAGMLEFVIGRYVRVGIARWFVFEQVSEDDGVIHVRGVFRAFRAEPTERDDSYAIAPVEVSAPVNVWLEPTRGLARVRARGASESSGALNAIQRVADVTRSPTLPLDFVAPSQVFDWDRRTINMLDLIAHRLNEPPFKVINQTMAHFEMDETERDEEDVARPRIRSVRLEGDYVVESQQACELMVAGRALVGMSVWVRFTPNANESFSFPIRITTSRDHFTILTGFGTEHPRHALAAHNLILDRVEGGFRRLMDPQGVVSLVERIRERAGERRPVEHADIFFADQETDE